MADPWRYWAITHADLAVMNPLSESRLDLAVGRMHLPKGAQVLDIACGKGELLIRLALRYGAGGTGVDISPYSHRDAKEAAHARAPRAGLRFVLKDGAAFRPPRGARFDAACCVGATWVFGGWEGTLRALTARTAPGGLIVVGHPFWRRPPSRAYLRAEGVRRSDFATRAEDMAAARERGLRLVARFTSTRAEWHHYESSRWRAAARFAAAHPRDPISRELLRRRDASRRAYLLGGKECLGWTLWIFRTPP
jgi:cyclopropane fatty-acyl-phospholipid synthase-like methyltransferase